MAIHVDTRTGPKVIGTLPPEPEPDPDELAEAEALLERLVSEAKERGTIGA